MGTISGCRYLKVNLKAKIYIQYMLTLLFKSVPTKLLKIFLIEDIFHFHLELRISPRIFENFETALMVYSGAWGKLIHEKKPEVKNLVALSL